MCPIFLKIGNFVIYWYGVMVAIGVFLSSFLFQKYALKEGYTSKTISEIIFWTVLIGIFGGRIFHVIVHFHYYSKHLSEIIRIRNGGLAIQGAILFSLYFIYVYSKTNRINFLKTVDLIAIVTPLGQAIGRIGCFLNGCCYGKATESFFGVKFPFLTEKVYPTELFYFFMDIILFYFLLTFNKKKKRDGEVLSLYLMGFGLIRYFIDFLRGDLFFTSLGLFSTQLIGIFIFMIGGILFSFFLLTDKNT